MGVQSTSATFTLPWISLKSSPRFSPRIVTSVPPSLGPRRGVICWNSNLDLRFWNVPFVCARKQQALHKAFGWQYEVWNGRRRWDAGSFQTQVSKSLDVKIVDELQYSIVSLCLVSPCLLSKICLNLFFYIYNNSNVFHVNKIKLDILEKNTLTLLLFDMASI